MLRFSMILAAATLAAIAPAHAAAPAAAPMTLTSTLLVDRLVDEDGVKRHVLAPAAKVLPGDHLVFTTRYANTSQRPFDHFVLTNPVPGNVVPSAEGLADADVSVDGGRTWGRLATLSVTDGKGGTRAAQGSDVTHVRWTLASVAPGAEGKFEYRAVVR